MNKTRFAVVSTDGIHVDQHFGKADRFLIYDGGGPPTLVSERAASPLSTGDPDHPFDPEKFSRIAALLMGCAKLYTTRIGQRPAEELTQMGIEPVIYKGRIADLK